MKSYVETYEDDEGTVTLCVRVWIEISTSSSFFMDRLVTLCVRVWIEIMSHSASAMSSAVTLCVRVWIEINNPNRANKKMTRHPLREGVD